MTVAEELRAWDWTRVYDHELRPLSGMAQVTLSGVKPFVPWDWGLTCLETRAEIMSEAIEAAEALGL